MDSRKPDSQVIGKSFYIGTAYPNTKVGDIFCLQQEPSRNKCWRYCDHILNEPKGYIKDQDHRKSIEEQLSKITCGDSVTVSWNNGLTFSNNLENNTGTTSWTDLSLLGPMEGTLNMNASFTPNAYSIWCKGHWESLQSPFDFLKGSDFNKSGRKLATMIKNPKNTYIMVTEVFKTSSDFVSFFPSEHSNNDHFNVELNNLHAAPSAVYKQLQNEINIKCPNSFEYSSNSIVPFFRGVQLQPLWIVDEELNETPPPKCVPVLRGEKPAKPLVTPQPDKVKIKQITHFPEPFIRSQ